MLFYWRDFMIKVSKGDISIVRGDTGPIHITILNSDQTEHELQTGDIVTFTVREDPLSDILIQKQGQDIIILPEDTSSLEFGQYCYDVQLTMNDGTVDTIIPMKTFTILEEVTY